MGEIETREQMLQRAKSKSALRATKKGSSFKVKVATVSGVREALARSHSRIIDFFKAVDKNGDGQITKAEFRAALPLMGLDDSAGSVLAIDSLFDSFDVDGSGQLTFDELRQILRYEATRLEQDEVDEEDEDEDEDEDE